MPAGYWDRERSFRAEMARLERIAAFTPVVLGLIAAPFLVSGRTPHREMTPFVGLRGPIELLPEVTIEPAKPSSDTSPAPAPAAEAVSPAVAPEVPDQSEIESSLALPEPNPPRPLTGVFPGHATGRPPSRSTGAGSDEVESTGSPSRPTSYSDTYVILHMVKPKYPSHERDEGIEGNVTVEFLVDETGHVAEARVVSLLGPVSFQESALEAVRQFLFQPPVEDGRASTMWITFLIKFRIVG